MESSEEISCGSFLGKVLQRVVENSLRKGRFNNNSKCLTGFKVLDNVFRFPSHLYKNLFFCLQQDIFVPTICSSELAVNCDPSYFATLALVRKLILKEQESSIRRGCNLVKLLCCSDIIDTESEDTLGDDTERKELCIHIPQVFSLNKILI